MDLRAAAIEAARRNNLDPDLFLRLIQQESGFQPHVTSSAGAYGPAQLMPGTAADLGVDPRDPLQNLEGGARYLRQQMDTFGDPRLALAAYNAGPGAVQKYGGIPPYQETQNYVASILGGPTSNLTVSSKGGTGMGLLDMPAEQPRTLMDRIRSPETVDNLLSWVNSMRLNPDPNVGGMIENRQARRAEADVANRTAQWLRSQGREDLAGAVESGTLGGREAASIFYQPVEAQGQVVTAEQLRAMYPGTQIEEGIYSQKPDGTISKIGGAAGPTVNVNTGGGKFEEGFAKADADLLGSVYASGLQATRNLGRIDQLGTLLQSAPAGAEGAFKLAAGEYGIATEGLDDIQAAQALINSLVPEQRQPGSGPMSDADLALFKQSLPRIVNQPGGNALILDTMRAIAQYDAQGAQIVQQLRSGEIDRPTAFQMLQDRPNPLGSFKAPAGAAGGGAGQPVVIDGVTIRKVN